MMNNNQEKRKYIYYLQDDTTLDIRYIGQTVSPINRLSRHISNSKKLNMHVNLWVRRCMDCGHNISLNIIDDCDINMADTLECMYIGLFKSWGYDLTNKTSGGQTRKKLSKDVIERLRICSTGKKQSPETIDKRKKRLVEVYKSNPELVELKRNQTKKLWDSGVITGMTGIPSNKKGKPFVGDKNKLSSSLKKYYSTNTNPCRVNAEVETMIISDYNNYSLKLSDIAKKYNIDRNTITTIAKRNGIRLRNDGRKKIEKDILHDLYIVKNMSRLSIAIKLCCSKSNVEKFIRIYKLNKK